MIDFANIFTAKNIIIYLVVINLITLLAMYMDKQKARKRKWRIKEGTLIILGALGGSIGGIIGIYAFRHKTQKLRFTLGFPVILITEVLVAIVLFVL